MPYPVRIELHPGPAPQDLILTCDLSPGDVLMMTAAVRDLHLAHPSRFRTDVRTPAESIWENNPYITPLDESAPGVRTIAMRYDLIHRSNQGAEHFIHGYAGHLEHELGLRIPITRFHGDIHLADQEKAWMNQVEEEPIGWRDPEHDEVRAAGGIVARAAPGGGVEVLVVHRPRYDDWSFPKGKCDPGEDFADTAVREVREETGIEVEVGEPVAQVAYVDHRGRPKVVRYWAMAPTGGSFTPNDEVDEVAWLSPDDARTRLTYPHDADLLDQIER